MTSNQKLYRLGDPENDLFSDAMDRAISMHHSVMHGARRNADRASEPTDGEKIARRALAAGIKAYLEEVGSVVETPADWRQLLQDCVDGWRKGDDIVGPMHRAESALKTPAHPDPTGTTREPPHCPTCACGLAEKTPRDEGSPVGWNTEVERCEHGIPRRFCTAVHSDGVGADTRGEKR